MGYTFWKVKNNFVSKIRTLFTTPCTYREHNIEHRGTIERMAKTGIHSVTKAHPHSGCWYSQDVIGIVWLF